MSEKNSDVSTVEGFGEEWTRFDQSGLSEIESKELFEKYFRIFPWDMLSEEAEGFDMGCGSGRWAKLVAPKVRKLHCIDPSSAVYVAKRNLLGQSNCEFYKAAVDDCPLPKNSMDFGYSLGVLHHVPNTAKGIYDCVRLLKPGAPFLLYLYYALEDRSFFYCCLWKISDFIRKIISRLPHSIRYLISQIIAITIYWPLARFSALCELLGLSAKNAARLPLGFYRHLSFYTMRTDSLDRFGTPLEHRFTKFQIQQMMEWAGLIDIRFSEESPYWCAVGVRGEI